MVHKFSGRALANGQHAIRIVVSSGSDVGDWIAVRMRKVSIGQSVIIVSGSYQWSSCYGDKSRYCRRSSVHYNDSDIG